MARNDPDGKHHNNSKTSLLEADIFRDNARQIERNYQTRIRQGLLSIARANLAKTERTSEAETKRGQNVAASGASGLQAFGSRQRAATSNVTRETRQAQAVHRLNMSAINQQMADDKEVRDAAHAVNLRELLAGRYA